MTTVSAQQWRARCGESPRSSWMGKDTNSMGPTTVTMVGYVTIETKVPYVVKHCNRYTVVK
jgi:hypothetical protein